jgi:hypothetical protein
MILESQVEILASILVNVGGWDQGFPPDTLVPLLDRNVISW